MAKTALHIAEGNSLSVPLIFSQNIILNILRKWYSVEV